MANDYYLRDATRADANSPQQRVIAGIAGTKPAAIQTRFVDLPLDEQELIEGQVAANLLRRQDSSVALTQENEGELNESVFAGRFVAEHEGTILVAPGERWMAYHPGPRQWRHDERAHDAREKLARQIRDHVRKVLPDEKQQNIRNRFLTSKTVGGALALAADQLYQWDVVFDGNPDIAGLAGGKVLCLLTSEVRDATPEDRITMTLGCEPIEGDSPAFDSFMDEVITDEATRQYVMRWLGYSLTGHTRSESFLFIHGEPGTGKSTMARIMSHVMGDYAATVAGEHVAGYKDSHRQWLARLQGKRFVTITELPKRGGAWNAPELNSLISGEMIEANRMRQDSIEFAPVSKLMIVGNDRPSASEKSGIFRRMRLIPCNHVPGKVDEYLLDKLRAEAPAILAKLVRYAGDWYRNNGLGDTPARIAKATNQYRDEQRDSILEDAIAALVVVGDDGISLPKIIDVLRNQQITRKRPDVVQELKRQQWRQARKAGVGTRLWVKPM